MDNETASSAMLSEFLAIPNIASDTQNSKECRASGEMLEARGIETPPSADQRRGRWFRQLITPEAKAHGDFLRPFTTGSG